MEPSDLPPLPPIKKRKQKTSKRGTTNRSRSFVAEMFHINKNPSTKSPKWSTNDKQLLQKLGISPNQQNRNAENSKMNISSNLHPDLKIAALEEQISSINIELQDSRNNLQKAAEYGQHLIEENQKLDLVVLELRNEAAEYIAQLCELREENNTFKLSIETNEYSVNDYENKMYEFKTDKDELNNKLEILNEEINAYKTKYEMELNKSKLYQNEIEKYQIEKNKLMKQYNKNIDQLKEKILVSQNTNHSLLIEGNQVAKKYKKLKQEMRILESEYNEICMHNAGSITGDNLSPHRLLNISRRRSPSASRSRSDKREDLEEKMDEIMNNNNNNKNGSNNNNNYGSCDSECDNENEYKSDPILIKNISKYNEILIECMDLFENILDNQHLHSPIKHKLLSPLKQTPKTKGIDIELFKDLMNNVRNKLRKQSYGGDIHKRNISELRDNSKSNSNFMETLEHCVIDSDKELKEEEELIENECAEELADQEMYEADNEELDQNLLNKEMIIEPINEKQKKCVEQFLVRYSENNSWEKNNINNKEYQIEIEFNESVNLINKKNNNITISQKLLQSLTNLIENIMEIDSENQYKMPYFSICGWFCGKSPCDSSTNYSEHYLNILSALDYNSENRDEIYWVIYQLLNIIYKYYNHSQKSYKNNINNSNETNGENNNGILSDSESMSLVYTSNQKSKYAELRPPKRRRNSLKNKIKGRASFHPLNDISSDDIDDHEYVE